MKLSPLCSISPVFGTVNSKCQCNNVMMLTVASYDQVVLDPLQEVGHQASFLPSSDQSLDKQFLHPV